MAEVALGYRDVTPPRASELLGAGTLRVLDVRTPEEYAQRGHIPGAILLPLDLLASAPATIPQDGRPLLVYCEHGIRSTHAASFLARAGMGDVLNLTGGMAAWTGPREFGPGPIAGPSSWLLLNAHRLPRGGRVLDVACGRGRHALLLAGAGFSVRAVDRDAHALDALGDTAARLGLAVQTAVVDLEQEDVDLGDGGYEAVLVVRYLHRPLFPALKRALAPGGVLVYETFTMAQAALGHPSNPAFLLREGELRRLVAPLAVLADREGEFEGAHVAGVVARRAGRGTA